MNVSVPKITGTIWETFAWAVTIKVVSWEF